MAARQTDLRLRGLAGEIRTGRLDNGLELCLVRNPQAPIVTSALFYRIGCRDEETGRGGTVFAGSSDGACAFGVHMLGGLRGS